MIASTVGRTDVVRSLITHGASVNARSKNGYASLMYAAGEGHLDTAVALLDAGADVNASTNDGVTVLMDCAAHQQAEAIALLLGHGAETNAKDKNGHTALIYAERTGNKAVIDLLAEGDGQEAIKRLEEATPGATAPGDLDPRLSSLRQGMTMDEARSAVGVPPNKVTSSEQYAQWTFMRKDGSTVILVFENMGTKNGVADWRLGGWQTRERTGS